jgi:hypothetical protein
MAYCTSADVKQFLPDAIVVEGDNPSPSPLNPRPESMTTIELSNYMNQADSIINSRLSGIYDIPLRRSNIGGVIGYPPPVPFIAAAITTYLVMTQRLSAGDRAQSSEYVKDLYDRAMSQLDQIFNGQARLMNQNSFTSHRTIKADLFSIPPGTSKEPAQSKR